MEFDLWDDLMAVERRMDDLFRAFMSPRVRTRYATQPARLRQPFLPATDVYVLDEDLVARLSSPASTRSGTSP